MKWNLVTFSDKKFRKGQEYLEDYSKSLGMNNLSYTYEWFAEQEFYKQHKDISDDEIGLGYFLWKSFIINDAINKLDDGDLIFYSDVGDMFHPELISFVEENIVISLSLFFSLIVFFNSSKLSENLSKAFKILSLLSIKISLRITGLDAAIRVRSLKPPALYWIMSCLNLFSLSVAVLTIL